MNLQPMSDGTRSALLSQLAEGAKLANSTIEGVAEQRQLFARLECDHLAELYRVLEFALLLRFDLSVLFADFIRHEHEESAHVYARYVILTIYEGTKTYRRMLGKDLQTTLAADRASANLVSAIRGIHKTMNKIAGHAEREYGDIRDSIAAHRDPEAVAQLRRLRTIGGEELASFVTSFLAASGDLEQLLVEITSGVRSSFDAQLSVICLHPGEQTTINVTAATRDSGKQRHVSPDELEWESSDIDVAIVHPSGVIEAVASGHTYVRFRSSVAPRLEGGAFVLVGSDAELAELQRRYRRFWQG